MTSELFLFYFLSIIYYVNAMCRMFHFNSSLFSTPSRPSPAHSFFVIGARIFVAAGSIFSLPILTCSAEFYKTFLLLRENGNPVRLSIPRASVFCPPPTIYPQSFSLSYLFIREGTSLAHSPDHNCFLVCLYFLLRDRVRCYAFVAEYFYILSYIFLFVYVCTARHK